jgi:ABC-2 type transport system ATP-binding protein
VGRSVLLFEGVDRQRLAGLGDVRTPSVGDLFTAVVGGRPDVDGGNPAEGAAR